MTNLVTHREWLLIQGSNNSERLIWYFAREIPEWQLIQNYNFFRSNICKFDFPLKKSYLNTGVVEYTGGKKWGWWWGASLSTAPEKADPKEDVPHH